uniref:Uncharacterized protein n=1 Tax=uncultured marine virus TaxID=186617 RepID=A0A0F7L715_9VIRU|nr:hypothetical protein [uncultured marine virus]
MSERQPLWVLEQEIKHNSQTWVDIEYFKECVEVATTAELDGMAHLLARKLDAHVCKDPTRNAYIFSPRSPYAPGIGFRN